jgi:hypothetical protein
LSDVGLPFGGGPRGTSTASSGRRLWGPHGFYDAFNLKEGWFAKQHLALDQGPIVVMIGNYRTALIWQTFMKCDDVQAGLEKLGFTWRAALPSAR